MRWEMARKRSSGSAAEMCSKARARDILRRACTFEAPNNRRQLVMLAKAEAPFVGRELSRGLNPLGGPMLFALLLAFGHGVVTASVQVFNIFLEPIKTSLLLDDFRISLLQGFAFGVFGAVIGLPAARVSDRGWRRNVAFTGTLLWSAGTAACALSSNYWQMFTGRAFVGIGEVFFLPAAISLLTLIVPRRRLALAMGLFVSGSSFGSAAAWIGGGWLLTNWSDLTSASSGFRHIEAWRVGFAAYAVVGVLAGLMLLAVREPASSVAMRSEPRAENSVLREVLRGGGRSVIGVLTAVLAVGFGSVAVYMWLPTVFVRHFGLSYAAVGSILGISFLVFCSIGAWGAGILADWLHKAGREDAPLIVLVAACATCALSLFAIALSDRLNVVSVVALGGALASSTMTGVVGPLALTSVSPIQARSQALSWQNFLMYLIPVGLAPSAVAIANEYIFKNERMVAWSVALIYAGSASIAAAILLWCRRDYIRRQREILNLDDLCITAAQLNPL